MARGPRGRRSPDAGPTRPAVRRTPVPRDDGFDGFDGVDGPDEPDEPDTVAGGRGGHRTGRAPPADPGLRTLLRALLDLPPAYRRTLLLYDGLGLDLPETAAETEASTPAAANRLLHAREAVAFRVPELAAVTGPEALSALLRRRIGELALVDPRTVTRLPGPRRVRTGGERRNRVWTRAAVTLTAVIVGATAFTLSTAPTRYIPPVSPGQRIGGVPLNSGPQRQSEEDVELHRKLLNEPAHGPERLVPEFR
ncbi:hypothetical protein A8W25_18655 [Streptomyces sp. ERV7]|uniref:sigma factor-like helix-turn-helix DNA-binding protein n=1 Tax=Streptomyces sp. ERV7 TaxID=1322334 RepID=UPI0007F4F816|nr:sigma factor-like helix-turn-helix DNA-binding protein [Streptomyces sp. ERV7]OAR24428.1 hypothetical protein A8W25_18655 [Streptomyces sp. ERV7]